MGVLLNEMKRSRDYWRSYRKIRTNVDKHISYIYSANDTNSSEHQSNISRLNLTDRQLENGFSAPEIHRIRNGSHVPEISGLESEIEDVESGLESELSDDNGSSDFLSHQTLILMKMCH